jgi:hypothetical protein
MRDVALTGDLKQSHCRELLLKWILLSVLVYWGSIAILYPVTTWDSQVYNLSRILVAEKSGFWQSTAWNSERQIMFPWTFDSVHYPLLKIGFGFALPSFLALLGILGVVYDLVSTHYDKRVALWACLTIVSMPTIVLQATTTKNDLVVVFSVACWVLALVRYRKNRLNIYILLAALALAFGTGSKTSGVGTCLICAATTLWLLRREWKALILFIVSFPFLLILFGSVETYVLNYHLYHNPLGPSNIVRDQSNHDGFRGAVANLIRYFFGNLSIGIDGWTVQTGFADVSQKVCRYVLNLFNLRETGYEAQFSDENLAFPKLGMTAGSDFGIAGAIAMLTAPLWVLSVRRSKFAAVSAIGGIASLILVSSGVAWMEWNARFLCITFTCFGVALAVGVFGGGRYVQVWQVPLGCVIILSAFSFPFLTYSCKPSDLLTGITDREEIQFSDRPEMQAVYDKVRSLNAAQPTVPWLLVAGGDSWTLPFLQMHGLELKLAPHLRDVIEWRGAHSGQEAFVLLLDQGRSPQISDAKVEFASDDDQILKIFDGATGHDEKE